MRTPRLIAAALLLGAPMAVNAQPSTDKLGEQGRPLTIDVSIGTESLDFGSILGVERGGRQGRLLALSAGARWRLAPTVGISATGWLLRRTSTSYYYYGPPGSPPVSGGQEQILAIGPVVDAGVRLGRQFHIAALAGVAAVPLASNSAMNSSESGTMFTLGLQLRYRRLTLTQSTLILLSAETAIQASREFYPVSIGWRF